MSIVTDALRATYWTRLPGPDGQGFVYRTPAGATVRAAAALRRIAALAIPPAWSDVCVAPDAEAALQAFGRDAAGRLQYRYHARRTEQTARRKWRRLQQLADALPRLRQVTQADLRRSGLPREKVLALMTRLLHGACFRVGSEDYLRRHHTHGLSTLHKRHLTIDGGTARFCYIGKGGLEQVRELRDRAAVRLLQRLKALPGRALFQYQPAPGEPLRRLRAADLNAYLREHLGPVTAKDFRTWGGTLRAAEHLAEIAEAGPTHPQAPRTPEQAVRLAIDQAARLLGNTRTVARDSYVCPTVIERFLEGRVLDDAGEAPAPRRPDRGLSRSEAALRRLLAAAPPRVRAPSPGSRTR